MLTSSIQVLAIGGGGILQSSFLAIPHPRDVTFSPRNENLNLLVQIKFFNLSYIYISNKTEKFTGLGLGDRWTS